MDFKLKRKQRDGRETISIKFKRGVKIGSADTALSESKGFKSNGVKPITEAALVGRDYPGVRFELLINEGDPVSAGQAVMRDRRRPDILFTAPASGRVSDIKRGARRALFALVIEIDQTRPPVKFVTESATTVDQLRQVMLQSGLWTCLRARPFDRIPDVDASPQALLITAVDTRPQAVDPAPVISAHESDFIRGIESIQKLCDGPVYLCKSAQAVLPPVADNVIVVEIDGGHPAGLPGTHIHALCPVGGGDRQVWHIDYQDVISLGKLLAGGTPWLERVIAVSDQALASREVASVPSGASLLQICAGQAGPDADGIIAGSAIDGRKVSNKDAYLGQRCRQITVLERPAIADSVLHPLIPTTDLDQAAPPGILATPFLRALLVGDSESVRDLGGLELVEEDLGLLSYLSTTGIDYGPLLRQTLEQLHKEMADR